MCHLLCFYHIFLSSVIYYWTWRTATWNQFVNETMGNCCIFVFYSTINSFLTSNFIELPRRIARAKNKKNFKIGAPPRHFQGLHFKRIRYGSWPISAREIAQFWGPTWSFGFSDCNTVFAASLAIVNFLPVIDALESITKTTSLASGVAVST